MSDDLVREKPPSFSELGFECEWHFCFGRQFGKSEAMNKALAVINKRKIVGQFMGMDIVTDSSMPATETYKFYRALGNK